MTAEFGRKGDDGRVPRPWTSESGILGCVSAPVQGSFIVAVESDPWVKLRTQRIGLMSFDLEAPVTAGQLDLSKSGSELQLTLNIAEVRVTNPLMQAAARALVGSGDNATLVFDAVGADDDPLRFLGTARAGDVEVPMEVSASLGETQSPLPITLTGWARFTDVKIPLPGMSRVNTIEVEVSAIIAFVAA